jgi:hypothetical protein
MRTNPFYDAWLFAAFAIHRDLVKTIYLPYLNIIDPLVIPGRAPVRRLLHAWFRCALHRPGRRRIARISGSDSTRTPVSGLGTMSSSRLCTCGPWSMPPEGALASTHCFVGAR